jgi:MFS family permease
MAEFQLAEDHLSGGASAVALSKKSVAAAIAGNVLEFYDFTTYSFFAVMIGQAYFPSKDPFVSLMLSIAAFGVGFVTRPVGGILIGAYADRAGRKPAMMLTVILMAIGMLIIALTPSYASIGVAAPIVVVLARLIQGFALGGEVGPATSFLIEAAPSNERGLYASWQLASQGVAILIAGAIGLALSLSLSDEAMHAWGWRVPFLVGILIIPVAIVMRMQMPETFDAEAPTAHHNMSGVLSALLTQNTRPFVLAFLLVSSGTISTYIMNYMTTYAITTLKMPTSISIAATLVLGLCVFVFSLVGGWLSDRIGRRPLIIWPRLVSVLAVYPAFVLINEFKSGSVLLGMTAFLAAVASLSSVLLVVIPEILPASVRSAGLSVSYALGVTLFGSTAQPIVAWLIHATGNPLSPAWYLILANLVGIATVLTIPETKDAPLKA